MASSSSNRGSELRKILAAQNKILYYDHLDTTRLYEIMGARSEARDEDNCDNTESPNSPAPTQAQEQNSIEKYGSPVSRSNSQTEKLGVCGNPSSSSPGLRVSPAGTIQEGSGAGDRSREPRGHSARKTEFSALFQLLEYFWRWAHFAQRYQWAFFILAVISAVILLFLCVLIWFWYLGVLGFLIGIVSGITRKLSSAVITTISVPSAVVGGLYDSTMFLAGGISNLSSEIYNNTSGAILDAKNALLMSSLSCLLIHNNSSSCAVLHNTTNETFLAHVNRTAEIYTGSLLPPEGKEVSVYHAFLGFAYTSRSTSSLLMHAAAGAKYQQPLGNKLHTSYMYGSHLFRSLSDALYKLVSSQASTYNVLSGEWLRVLQEVDAYDAWFVQAGFYSRFFEKENQRFGLQLRYVGAINRTLFQVTKMINAAERCDTILHELSQDFMERTSDNLAANEHALAERERKLRGLNLGLSWWKFWAWGERKLQGEVLNSMKQHFVFLQSRAKVTGEVINAINHRLMKAKIALEGELQYAENMQWSDIVRGNGTGNGLQLLRAVLIELHMRTEEQYQVVQEALKRPRDEYEGAKGREFHGIYPFF